MKVKKLAKLKYNIWFYFILFAVAIFALIWVFQIVLFDGIYQQHKFNNLRDKGNNISAQFNTNDEVTQETLNSWVKQTIDLAEQGYALYLVDYVDGNVLDIDPIYGDQFAMSDFSESEMAVISEGLRQYAQGVDDYSCVKYDYAENDTYFIYTTAVSNAKFGSTFLVISTSLNSLDSTIFVIQIQLAIVCVIVLALSLLLALYISNKLANPIIEMSKTAKSWAEGDEKVTFKASSYQEIAELAEALNYAKEGIAKTGSLERDLLANVSHDLKTPLTMIKSYAEMIRDISGDNKQKRDLHTQVIIDEADRLTMLVNDILDISKAQNGMDQLNLASVNLSELCETVLFRFNDFAESSGYKIITDIEADLFSVIDEKKIEQVIYNLIGNSINYTGEDKTIFVSLKKKGKKIVFETIDTGKGISKEKIDDIWKKYFRESETHQRPIKGTGLGLSIVKAILESHNLRFGVISEKDVGSNFFIEFIGEEDE